MMLVPLSSCSSRECGDLALEMTCSAFNSTMKTGQFPSHFSLLEGYHDLRLAKSLLRSSFSPSQKTVEKTVKPLKSGESVVISEHNKNGPRRNGAAERGRGNTLWGKPKKGELKRV